MHDDLKKIISEEYDSPDALLKAERLKEPHIPKTLFKFRKFGKLSVENLKTDTLYCAKAITFNDPFDCTLTFGSPHQIEVLIKSLHSFHQFTEERATRLRQAVDIDDCFADIVREFEPSLADKDKEQMKKMFSAPFHEPIQRLSSSLQDACNICSLCESIDSLPMWAHYGDDHKGFAMEYDFTTLPTDNLIRRSLWPVFYENNLYDVSNQIWGRKVDTFNELFVIGGALQKCLDWKYEKEWRIILTNRSQKPAELLDVPAPIAIYLGAKISNKAAKKLAWIAKQKNIPVYQMAPSRNEYKMQPFLVQAPQNKTHVETI
ncbi:DUF2971 domain-containing protein [Pseudomonas sp. V88_4]|uniref:DUF2971 domain-containing protein n=1 Tax=Pseudomonas sp. V88_4 TaxID=3044229 RepID=UPI00249EDF04|nr:DUF2971 domain-containing protein [Pseudomonas sp. V88_4]MDI3398573.1 DUF2971 domain-containing protein [Pseudomonas sp. V88_4]